MKFDPDIQKIVDEATDPRLQVSHPKDGAIQELANLAQEARDKVNRHEKNALVVLQQKACVDPVFSLCAMYIELRNKQKYKEAP